MAGEGSGQGREGAEAACLRRRRTGLSRAGGMRRSASCPHVAARAGWQKVIGWESSGCSVHPD